jgi:hypothetical protein
MYEPHRCFQPPPDDNASIWRYTDLAKLVFLLHTKSLHFTRLDCFEDRFEGALPKRYVEGLREARDEDRAKHPELWKTLESFGQVTTSATQAYQESRPRTAVNCWHQNEYESAAMWSQYVRSSDGVAIRSTYRRLINAFDAEDDSLLILIGMVQYIDYDNDVIENFNNALLPVLHKRASFRHEHELRAVALGSTRHGEDKGLCLDLREFPKVGIDVAVDLNQLLDAIYVAPGAPGWFRLSVESVVSRYGLAVPVKQSSLDDEPLW